MAPIKFEEQIKDKLEQRTVQPSANAWSKLSQRLDDDKQRNGLPWGWWFGIAASIAVLIALSINYFNSVEAPQVEQIIVKENTSENKPSESNNNLEPDTKVEIVEATSNISGMEQTKAYTEKETPKPSDKTIVDYAKTDIAKTESAVEKTDENEVLKTKNNELSETPLEQKFKNVVAELQKIKEKNNTVTDHQIDSLLKVASKELLRDKIFEEGSNVVDADALLQDVEDDLGQSFRTRVYEALKEGFNTVKTAVADRNN